MTSNAYIGLGSNMGDRRAIICDALTEIARLANTSVLAVSSMYETAPWGGVEQPAFLNAVASVGTDLSPEHLLQQLLAIETRLGRVRKVHWGPRVIDLDLLLYDAVYLSTTTLTLPHPFMLERRFVLQPLVELNKDVKVNGKTVIEHLQKLNATQRLDDVVVWSKPPHSKAGIFS